MLLAYSLEDGALRRLEDGADLSRAIWIDLVRPTAEEERQVEALIGTGIPTREEMVEIEPSSRLYLEDGARFLTATLLFNSLTGTAGTTAITFILRPERLVSLRYEEPKPFALFCARASKPHAIDAASADAVLYGLLDTIIDRIADIFEKVAEEIDAISAAIFGDETRDYAGAYRDYMRTLGRKGELIAKARDSLVSLSRLLLFLTTDAESLKSGKEAKAALKIMQRDVESLAQHADSLSSRVQLLLDAVVGMVSIEQNAIIKIFAVLSVVLMPPTLVASIYGMNFRVMPELDWTWGYPLSLALMLLAGAVPYLLFKWKRWL